MFNCIISVKLAKRKKIIPDINNADDKLNWSVYQPKRGPIIAKKILITKLRTDKTVALTLESHN